MSRVTLIAVAALTVALLPRPVHAQADFSAQATPDPVTLTAGGSPVTVTVTTTITGTFTEPIQYSFSGLPAGVVNDGPRTATPPYAPVTFSFSAGAGVLPGTYPATLLGTALSTTRTFPFTVIVAPAADFTLSVNPTAISLRPGQSSTVTLAVNAIGGLSSNVQVNASVPAGLSVQPTSFTVPPGGQTTVNVTVAAGASVGLANVGFTGTAAGVAGSRSTTLSVTVLPNPPEIESVSPPSLVSGSSSTTLRITGRNFDPAAIITSRTPGVQLLNARILSSTTAEATVSVRADVPPGPAHLDLQNPDGAMAAGGARLLVYPTGALSAPLSVTSAQIVAPRQWEIVAPGDEIRARALLATSGLGTVVGTWLLDGVPFDHFTRVVSGGLPVEVTSSIPIPQSYIGEHRLELLIESPLGFPAQRLNFIQAVERRSRIQLLMPAAGAEQTAASTIVRWTLVPGASGYVVEVESIDDTSNTESHDVHRFRTTDTEWRPSALLRQLGPGRMRVRVRAIFPGDVEGDVTPWHPFIVTSLGEGARLPPGVRQSRTVLAAAPGAAFPLVWRQDEPRATQMELTLNSTTANTWSDLADPPPTTRLQLSKQFDLHGGIASYQATADVSGVHDLDTPWNGRAENANWLAQLNFGGERLRQETRIGFAPPTFFDQSEFLSVFTSGGALEGALSSPAGRVAYFHTARLGGAPGISGTEPKVQAAAYEAKSGGGRLLFRTMLLRVTEPDADGLETGNRGNALGMLGVLDLGPRLRLLGEAARGDLTPGADSFEEERDGGALRLSLQGTAGTFGYSLAVGRTNEGFVNPANPGFTPGGISGRTRSELGLQKRFGRATWSGSHGWTRGGVAQLAGDPKTTENSTRMSLNVPLSQRLSFAAGGILTTQRGDGSDDMEFPETDRRQQGADVSLSERLGRLTLTQSWSWQRLDDDVQPFVNQSLTTASLAATGALASFLSLSANVSDQRIRPVAEFGMTRRLLLALQPSLSIPRLAMQLAPRSSYSRTWNDTQESDFRTAMHQVIARFQPGWLGSIIVLEVSSDWTRNWSALVAERPPFQRSTVATLSLNWRADRMWGARASGQ